MIRIVDGNAFCLRITGQIKVGDYTEAVSLANITSPMVYFTRRGREVQDYVLDNGKLLVSNSGNLAIGVYSVEIIGYYQGQSWRHMQKNAFEIVDSSSDATEPDFHGAGDVDGYDTTFNVSMGGEEQAAEIATGIVDQHDEKLDAHPALRALIPTKVSELPNDSGYQTSQQVAATVESAIEASQINEVGVDLVENGGEPSGYAGISGQTLNLVLRNIKGDKGDPLTFEDLTEEQIEAITGPQGQPGTSVIVGAGDLPLANAIDTSTNKAITPNAVLEAITPIMDGDISLPAAVVGAAINSSGGPNTAATAYGITDFVKLGEGQTTVKVKSGAWQYNNYAHVIYFYTAANQENALSGLKLTSTSTEAVNKTFDVPTGAKYYRLTIKHDTPAIVEAKGSIVKDIEDLKSSVDVVETAVETMSEGMEGINDGIAACKESLNIDTRKYRSAETSKLLKSTGIAASSSTKYGVTDFIPVSPTDTPYVISGAYKGGTGWVFCCFYSSDSEEDFISSQEYSTANTEVTNTAITVPQNATHMRFSMKDNSVPVVVRYAIPIDVQGLQEDVEDLEQRVDNLESNLKPIQIKNNPLPIKSTSEPLKVLYLGSSYGVDTIDAFVDICTNVGLNVTTYDAFISGGTLAQYIEKLEESENDFAIYAQTSNPPANWDDTPRMTVSALIKKEPWDIIILEDEDVRSPSFTTDLKTDLVKFLRYIKTKCTNPRVVFALNSTWTHSVNKSQQGDSFKVVMKDMANTGIDIVIPSGAAINLLRETAVNTGHDIYRDDIHLDTGVGRFTAACAAYFATAYYIYGVDLTNCTTSGRWNSHGSIVNTYGPTDVDGTNRSTCIACAKQAAANRFLSPEESE